MRSESQLQPIAAAGPRWQRMQPLAQFVDRLVFWLDNAFEIPGTRFRVGLDPIIGFLFPGVGDAIGGVVSVSVMFLALQQRLPLWVVGRMLVNSAVDASVGSIPGLGDVFDVAFKANQQNLALLREHEQRPATRAPFGYWLVGFALLAVAGLCALVPLLLGIWLLRQLFGSG